MSTVERQSTTDLRIVELTLEELRTPKTEATQTKIDAGYTSLFRNACEMFCPIDLEPIIQTDLPEIKWEIQQALFDSYDKYLTMKMQKPYRGIIHPRDIVLLIRRYGLENGTSMTLEKTGEIEGLSKERTRQLLNTSQIVLGIIFRKSALFEKWRINQEYH